MTIGKIQNYDQAVEDIKTAILQSQYEAVRSVNEKQLMLYYGIGKYISLNSRKGFWGKGAIDAISERLDKELPGLKGFSARNLRYMRTFYEEWAMLDSAQAKSKDDSNLEHACAKFQKDFYRSVFEYRLFSSPIDIVKSKKRLKKGSFIETDVQQKNIAMMLLGEASPVTTITIRAACRTTSCRRCRQQSKHFAPSIPSRMNICWTISMWRNWASVTNRMWMNSWWKTPSFTM